MLSSDDLSELSRYLSELDGLLRSGLLDERCWNNEPTTCGQVAFHAVEAADFWIRSLILKQPRQRDRDAEFRDQKSRERILQSLANAVQAVEILKHSHFDPSLRLSIPPEASPTGKAESWLPLTALIHVTAHTAEHVGHLAVAMKRETTKP